MSAIHRLWMSRWVRTPILFAAGLAASFVVAVVWSPHLPSFCRGITVGEPCEPVTVATATGYLTIALGWLTLVFGPIFGSLLDLAIHGASWEASRVETAPANLPIVAGIVYLVVGALIVAWA